MTTVVIGLIRGCIVPVACDSPVKLVVYDYDCEGIPSDMDGELRLVDGDVALTDQHDVPLDPALTELFTRIQEKGGEIKNNKEVT